MPEVIEVLKYADFLRSKLKNQNILKINIRNGRYKTHGAFENFNKLHYPLKVVDIKTKGKFLYFVFDNGLYLFSTLGLSGGWVWSKDNKTFDFANLLKKVDDEKLTQYHKNALNHLNVEFQTSKGILYYYDVLSFGTLKVVITEEELNKKLNSIGPDITAETTTYPVFKERFVRVDKSKAIGVILMNQRIISGIGNYLRADVLWLCKISPFKKLEYIKETDLRKIWKYSRMLTWAKYDYKTGLKKGFIDHDHQPLPEDYDREFYVYNQLEDPNGKPVEKIELYEGSQKRFIHWVPSVQQ